jgi:hypothetical protein
MYIALYIKCMLSRHWSAKNGQAGLRHAGEPANSSLGISAPGSECRAGRSGPFDGPAGLLALFQGVSDFPRKAAVAGIYPVKIRAGFFVLARPLLFLLSSARTDERNLKNKKLKQGVKNEYP